MKPTITAYEDISLITLQNIPADIAFIADESKEFTSKQIEIIDQVNKKLKIILKYIPFLKRFNF